MHFVRDVYGTEFTDGIIEMTYVNSNTSTNTNTNTADGKGSGKHARTRHKKNKSRKNSKKGSFPNSTVSSKNNGDSEVTTNGKPFRYTVTHLRSIELTVVARVLSLPEPKTGYFVSKSWIKKTLLFLEKVNEQPMCTTTPKKKLTKKQERQRNRRLSDVTAPWPNANSDIICEHQNLQRSGAKAARSHRKLMDKKSWKVLRKLYPDSTQLDSVTGECLQCMMEAETARKDFQDKLEQQKLERKKPLSNPHVRRFYTRTRGVPYHCLVENADSNKCGATDVVDSDDGGEKMCAREQCPSPSPYRKGYSCPLTGGTYVILPRSWCHQWRRYIKTGEGCMPIAPESSALLCDAHKLVLLPPHLEAFLRGETAQLFASVKENRQDGVSSPSPVIASVAAASVVIPRSPVGVQPVLDAETIHALMAAGISRAEAAAQVTAMQQLEEGRERDRLSRLSIGRRETERNESTSSVCNNKLLDRENHVVVELVTHEEWLALQEAGCWRKQVSTYSMCVTVDNDGSFALSTLPCRECDPTGLRFSPSCASMKNMFRSKRWEPKNVENKRIPNLEY